MRHASAVTAALALLLVFAPTPAFAGWPHFPASSGLSLSGPGSTAANPSMVADGAGGVFIAWYEFRSGSYDIYAQRVNSAGVPLWTANGVPVCAAGNQQFDPVITPDGQGGALLAWTDYRSGAGADIYAQRLNSAGTPLWTVNGVAVSTVAGDQVTPRIAADGTGGVAIVWMDLRTPANGYDIYGERLVATGIPVWSAGGGLAIAAVAGQQANPVITYVSGGTMVAYVAWDDTRSGNSDIYVQRIGSGGTLSFAANGLAVCNDPASQYAPALVTDPLAGAAYVAWEDDRVPAGIYAQRVSSGGSSQWALNGKHVCASSITQRWVSMVADGHLGLLLAWEDYRGTGDIYAQRLDTGGNVLWAADGVAVCTAPGAQLLPLVAADGAGGAIVAWTDLRYSVYDLYAQHVGASGYTQWNYDGVPVCTAAASKQSSVIAGDDAGNSYVAWWDYRSNTNAQVFLQRVDEWGALGAEPALHGVKDVPNDNGGKVKLSWDASPLDTDPAYRSISDYLVLRSAPPLLVQQALRSNRVIEAGAVPANGPDAASGTLVATRFAAQVYYWEQIGTVAAIHTSGYSFIAPTTGDSMGAGNPRTLFAVMARGGIYSQFWTSPPDSGYSVDNVPPFTPAPFTAQYATGTTMLHWNPNTDTDLANYQLYRGTSTAFVPGPDNLIASPADTGYIDVAGAPYVYKLVAIDVHGNASPAAVVTPAGTLGVPTAAPLALALAAPSPNPLRAGAATTLRFASPVAGRVAFALYDASGRRTRMLTDGVREAGEYSLRFDGRTAGGSPLAPGLYFLRLETTAGTRCARLAVIE